MLMQVGILGDRGRYGLVTEQACFGQAAMPFICGEIALADAHQCVQFATALGGQSCDGFAQCLGLRCPRTKRFKSELCGGVVLSACCLYLAAEGHSARTSGGSICFTSSISPAEILRAKSLKTWRADCSASTF